MPAIGGRPAIGGAPETARCGFAAYRSAIGKGTLDSDEIWYGSWPLYDTHSCQVSRQSIMAFVRYDCRNAKPTVRALWVCLPIPGSVRRLLFRNGSTDSSQVWQATGDVPSAGAHQISSRSGRTARPILVKFSANIQAVEAKKRTTFQADLAYRFRMPADTRQTHNARTVGFAFRQSQRTNATIDCHDIWQECVVCHGQQPYQISSESNVPFPNAERNTANPQRAVSGAPPIAGLPPIAGANFLVVPTFGTPNCNETWHDCCQCRTKHTYQISSKSNVGFRNGERRKFPGPTWATCRRRTPATPGRSVGHCGRTDR